ncbi:hypothetical protein GOFOIKOB_0315 [Methylobacterium tardum]|jgi:hypothetical protein|uniref:Uncharacterized protein n=1 Tax=Methylobacterium tardum TaxID=374432 RepID=A0AA37WSM3_9HYPH|nr:hypothetical protein [Methylobacterium tardum]URD36859.1 hypothetical protein M6G65_31925 [Methylobacterium tardum]GJE47294.1 hypothetical protein GOFOIKOB_0315 [Methylobacterium tardum]GLS71334.1 hypothetical protein GCM10007890_33470 [Methylobacterium tardum]
MNIERDIKACETGLTAILFEAHLQGQARQSALRQASSDNAVASVDRLGRELLASRRREAALARRVAELEASLRSERARPRAADWGTGYARRA